MTKQRSPHLDLLLKQFSDAMYRDDRDRNGSYQWTRSGSKYASQAADRVEIFEIVFGQHPSTLSVMFKIGDDRVAAKPLQVLSPPRLAQMFDYGQMNMDDLYERIEALADQIKEVLVAMQLRGQYKTPDYLMAPLPFVIE